MFRASLAASLGILTVATLGVVGLVQPEASSSPATIGAATPQLSRLVGFIDARLVRVDPETLRPRPGKQIAVGSGGCASRSGGSACWSNPPWTVSPDGQQLLLARNDLAALQIVDARRMRVTAKLSFNAGSLGSLAWLERGRALALEEICCRERQRLVAVDLAAGRVIVRRALGGSILQLARTDRELVLLLAPAQEIGVARLAVADALGTVRSIRLERIVAGSKVLGTGSQHRVDARMPGLAVDSEGRRAFVIAKGIAAEVDLRTLAVSYHSLEGTPSLLSRLWNWLEPAAAAKQVSGYHRQGRWLGADLIAVSGADTTDGRYQPTGLLVIDTRAWTVRTIDRGAIGFALAGDLLLTTGSGIGLTAYGLDGRLRFRLFEGREVWLDEAYGGRAFVGFSGQPLDPLQIVDLASGRVVGTSEQPLPTLLLGSGSGWWGDG